MRLRLFAKLWLLTLLILVLLVPVCVADHLPPELQARGKVEKTLAGILIDHSKVSDVIKMYGKPSEVKQQTKPADLNVVDTYDYYWVKSDIKLHLIVYRGNEIKGSEYIALIEVEGSRAKGMIGRTGSGLKLGDSLADVKRIYGRRFHERNLPKLKIHDVMVQWRSEEFSLVAEIDRRGKVKKLSLSPPE